MNGRLEAEKDVMGAFERYRAGLPGVGLQGLAQMCADVKLLPSPLSYVQIRAHFNSARPGDDGLNYSSFLNTLLVLARLAFDDGRADPAEKLMAALRKHLPAPPAQFAFALMQRSSGEENEENEENDPQGDGAHDSSVSAVGKWIANKTEIAQGLEESLSRVKQEAQRRLEKLAEDFAKKQVELHEQRVVAERELEAEVQLELAQNAARSTRQRRSSARPSIERLNLEEKIAALDRSRACRPSRSFVDDGSMEKLDSERAELVREVTALKVRFLRMVCHWVGVGDGVWYPLGRWFRVSPKGREMILGRGRHGRRSRGTAAQPDTNSNTLASYVNQPAVCRQQRKRGTLQKQRTRKAKPRRK